MAEQRERARHAFGKSSSIEAAKQANKIDAFDILFLDGDTDDPKVGWLDSQGNTVVVPSVSEVKGQVADLETELANKVSAEEVDTKIDTAVTEKVETVVEQVETIVTEKVETVVNEKVDTQVETIVETKVDAAIDEKVEGAVNTAREYTDSKIAEIENSYGIIEF